MSVKLGFVGDINFGGTFYKKCEKNETIFSEQIIKIFSQQDLLICNFEGPATLAKNLENRIARVVNPPQSVSYLSKYGFNIFNLANNHMFDCGTKGFLDTKKQIENIQCSYFGSGENLEEASKVLYKTVDGIKFAFIGISHDEGLIATKDSAGIFCKDNNFSLIKEKVQEARINADWVILNYHGGEEFTTIPMPSRRRLLKKYLKLDVDIIVAHHSHTFQGYEKIGNKVIFYSLGNFVFDLDIHKYIEYVDNSAILLIEFQKNSFTYTFYPTIIDREEGMIKEGDLKFIQHIDRISDFKTYYTSWFKDANRNYNQPLQLSRRKSTQKNRKRMIYKIKKVFSILKNPNRREIVISSHLYRLYIKLTQTKVV